MPDMFCYMSVYKSRVANISFQATKDVYFREHGGWIKIHFIYFSSHSKREYSVSLCKNQS